MYMCELFFQMTKKEASEVQARLENYGLFLCETHSGQPWVTCLRTLPLEKVGGRL